MCKGGAQGQSEMDKFKKALKIKNIASGPNIKFLEGLGGYEMATYPPSLPVRHW